MMSQDPAVGPHGRTIVACSIGIGGVALGTVLLWVGKISDGVFAGMLLLISALSLYAAGPGAWSTWRRPDRSGPEDTPRAIAFSLLVCFGAAIGFTGIVAAVSRSTEAKDWLEVFKSGFLLLGGGVTTIIGYYFGSRETTKAFESADALAPLGSGGSPIEGPRPKGSLGKTRGGGKATTP